MRKGMNFSWPVRGLLAAAAILAVAYAGHYADPRVTNVALAEDAAAAAPGGELIYVPIYSSIFYEDGKRTLELAATLSIHNVNPDRSITVTRADYYNTDGKLIKKYVDKPLVLAPLQTTNLVVEKKNVAGGVGANFLVEWQSAGEVNSPLVEAMMVNASSNLGIAFTSTGKVLKRLPAK